MSGTRKSKNKIFYSKASGTISSWPITPQKRKHESKSESPKNNKKAKEELSTKPKQTGDKSSFFSTSKTKVTPIKIPLLKKKPVIKPKSNPLTFIPVLPPLLIDDDFELEKKITPSPIDSDLLSIIKNEVDSLDHHVPLVWPEILPQKGSCCGLYALHAGLKFCFPHYKINPPRKEGVYDTVSIRQVAKEKGMSAFGEIFDVRSFQLLAEHFGFYNGEPIFCKDKSKKDYIKTLCEKIKTDGCVIVSLDCINNHPDKANGLKTHWALVFGYYYARGECNLLAAQYGTYFIWSADALYESNKQLPIENPRCAPHFFYYKNNNGEKFFSSAKDVKETHVEKRFAIGKTLSNFALTLFSMKTCAPRECMEFKLNYSELVEPCSDEITKSAFSLAF